MLGAKQWIWAPDAVRSGSGATNVTTAAVAAPVGCNSTGQPNVQHAVHTQQQQQLLPEQQQRQSATMFSEQAQQQSATMSSEQAQQRQSATVSSEGSQ